ncbi:hypothetical protein D3C77_708350 [compost metagenome]
MHDPPHGTKQADIRADGTHGAEERNMVFQRFQLTIHRNTHRTRCAFDHRLRRMAVSAVQTGKLFETGMENLL